MSKTGSSSSKPGAIQPYPPSRPPSRAGTPEKTDIDLIHAEALKSLNYGPKTIKHVLSLPVGDKRTEFVRTKILPDVRKQAGRDIVHQHWPPIQMTQTTPPKKKQPPVDPVTPTPRRVASRVASPATQLPPTFFFFFFFLTKIFLVK